jgi:tRNA A-37 threonylcarbamoyl transferase component Bud32
MKHLMNDKAELHYDTTLEMSLQAMLSLLHDVPHVFQPVRKADEKVAAAFATQGFRLYPTVVKTTLLYDERSDCFFKVLQPITLKKRALFAVKDRALQIFTLSEELRLKGIPVPKVMAYGKIKRGHRPVFAMKRVSGRSLYDMLIRENRMLPNAVLAEVMRDIAKFHQSGYWFGDAHLSHIFIVESSVSGFIDIDSIRKNRRKGISNFAKDLAGLNHPRLPMTEDEKSELLFTYLKAMEIQDAEEFIRAVKHFTELRWKA